MDRHYAIGDVHGALSELKAAHARIARDRKETGDESAPVIHLGDLVDRGAESKDVIQFMIDGIAAGQPWISVRGNHDQMFMSQLGLAPEAGEVPLRTWASEVLGGRETCLSYGVSAGLLSGQSATRRKLADAVPDAHKAFLRDLPLYYETDEVLFVHAGIRPGLPMTDQIPHDLLWIRGEFLNDLRDHGRLVIHGHTPVTAAMHYGNRVNLDTGAGYGRSLTAAVIEGREIHLLTDEGRVPLRPARSVPDF